MGLINPVYIIAEAGVNHNGSPILAREMVDAAKKAGADAIKFQTYKAGSLVADSAPKAEYQLKATRRTESQKEMLERLELNFGEQEKLFRYTCSQGLDFISSPFDLESVAFLAEMGLEKIKIPSGEITNLPYLRAVGSHKWQVILSTGMSFLHEVEQAVSVLAASGVTRKNMVVLHCNTEYPTHAEDVNLRTMAAMGTALGVDFGYSDHTLGIEISVAAAALGAAVIEKHFTLDKKMEGPDQRASLDPDELEYLVRAVRNVEMALGGSEKKPSASEISNRSIARKSIVAARQITKGSGFQKKTLPLKGPAMGFRLWSGTGSWEKLQEERICQMRK